LHGANVTSKESAYRFLPFGKRSLFADAFVEPARRGQGVTSLDMCELTPTTPCGRDLPGGRGQVPDVGSLSGKVVKASLVGENEVADELDLLVLGHVIFSGGPRRPRWLA